MPVFKDQTGKTIFLDKVPERIVSLVPSQTELLYELGLDTEVVGITKFCVHPQHWFKNKTRVGGTKQIRIELIHSLQPDLIIANKEENVKEQIEELEKLYPVWISDVGNFGEALEMIQEIGLLVKKEEKANGIIQEIKSKFDALQKQTLKRKAVYLIWQDPFMSIGRDTFIHSMLELAGFENLLRQETRYPEISLADLIRSNPEVLLLPSEPFPFKQVHGEMLHESLPGSKILLVDGEMFSWYGSRMKYAADYFKTIIDQLSE